MIDTHCHIDDEQYRDHFDTFIASQQEGGVSLILVPATDAASSESVLATCERYPNYLLPALGLHPEEVKEDWQAQLDSIYAQITRLMTGSAEEQVDHQPSSPARLVAIGEIGLDYHWDTTYREQQQLALRQQLDWALRLDLPVMLHARDCTEDMLTILRDFAPRGLRGVMHCYSGSYETAMEIVGMGLYLGIGGVITFKNCKLASALVPADGRPAVPLNRLLLETDAPYMAPVPHRGERNESRWMSLVVDRLADTYQISPDEVEFQTDLNAKTLFRL